MGKTSPQTSVSTQREDIIIKPADKGSDTDVMDMDWYENECLRQLNNSQFYEKIDKDLTPHTHECVKTYISSLQYCKELCHVILGFIL